MSHLSSTVIPEGYEVVSVDLSEIMLDGGDNYLTFLRTHNPAVFQRQREIFKSIATDGMMNPIVILDNNVLVSGGARVQFAVAQGYISIDAIIVADYTEGKVVQKDQVKSEIGILPDEYVYHQILNEEV